MNMSSAPIASLQSSIDKLTFNGCMVNQAGGDLHIYYINKYSLIDEELLRTIANFGRRFWWRCIRMTRVVFHWSVM
jgi:hypothetical protein